MPSGQGRLYGRLQLGEHGNISRHQGIDTRGELPLRLRDGVVHLLEPGILGSRIPRGQEVGHLLGGGLQFPGEVAHLPAVGVRTRGRLLALQALEDFLGVALELRQDLLVPAAGGKILQALRLLLHLLDLLHGGHEGEEIVYLPDRLLGQVVEVVAVVLSSDMTWRAFFRPCPSGGVSTWHAWYSGVFLLLVYPTVSSRWSLPSSSSAGAVSGGPAAARDVQPPPTSALSYNLPVAKWRITRHAALRRRDRVPHVRPGKHPRGWDQRGRGCPHSRTRSRISCAAWVSEG